MSQSKSPESAPIEPERKKSHLNIPLMVKIGTLATLIASAGPTIEANMPMPNKNPNVKPPTAVWYGVPNPNNDVLNIGFSAGMHNILPGEIGFKLPDVEATAWIPGSKKTETTQKLEQSPPTTTVMKSEINDTYNQPMEWAEKFEKDPSAVEPRGPEAIKDAVERIKELETQEYTCEVFVEGSSSDESNVRDGNNPGFGINDEPNIKLAETRAEAVAELFIQELKNELGEEKANDIEKSMVILGGKEVRDDQLAKAIEEMADKLGMPMDDLVMQFNRNPETLPIEAQEVLDGLYGDRKVIITIKATKQSFVELPSDPEMVTTTTTEKEDDKVVKIIIVPVLFPVIKRRTENVKGIPPTTPPSTPPPYPRQTGFTDRPGEQYNDSKKPGGYDKRNLNNISPVYYYGKQPRPFNGTQGATWHSGDRQTRSRGGDAH